MPGIDKLDSQWLMDERSNVSTAGPAWLLLSGYQASGFGLVTEDRVILGLTPNVPEFAPEHLWDVRLFGDKGEWHCWRVGSKWKGRLALAEAWEQPRERKFALWGTDVRDDGDWWSVFEKRGAAVKVPKRLWPELNTRHLPLLLCVWERVDQEPDTGLAGVGDAMLRGLLRQGDEVVI